MRPKNIVIIGAGIGGIATANLLAGMGHTVSVYEKEAMAGGRAGKMSIDGFTFDTGPSWYLMPEVFEHYFQLLNEDIDDWLKLEKLTPAYKVFFEHSDSIVVTGDIEQDAKTFDTIEQGSGDKLRSYVKKSDEIYRLSLDRFLYSNFETVRDFLHTDVMAKVFRLPTLLLTPIDTYVRKYVSDVRLQQILEYPMVFLGTSPFTAPSMYSLMSALDFKEGVYYPQGGMYTIIESLVEIGRKRGVAFHFESDVSGIETNQGRVTGIRLSDGRVVEANIVISNADLHYTETTLLRSEDQTYPQSYWDKKEAGPSALLMYLGIDGKVPEFEHHNLLLVDDWKGNFDAIYNSKAVPEHASIYISKTSHTDPSVAPAADENIFILVPLPSGISLSDTDIDEMYEHYMKQIQNMTGAVIKDRVKVKKLFTPDDFTTQFHSWQASMLGQSHLLNQSAFFRTPNKSKKVQNLYYVGGSTTPGIGLPMCLIGAELVYKRIIGNKNGGRVTTIRKVDQP